MLLPFVSTLVPNLPGMIVDQVHMTEQLVRVLMRTTSPTADCPVCGQPSDRVHSRYQRAVMDLPWADRIFAERLPGLVRLEVLLDKQAATFASWLQEHPEVTIISRDRDSAFADGARQGAPQATQVADRWHLTQNLGEALQRLLARHPAALQAAAQEPLLTPTIDVPTVPARVEEQPTSPEPAQIAQHLNLNWRTMKRYIQARELPKRGAPSIQHTSSLRPYQAYLQQRWAEGVPTACRRLSSLKAPTVQGRSARLMRARGWRKVACPFVLQPPIRKRLGRV